MLCSPTRSAGANGWRSGYWSFEGEARSASSARTGSSCTAAAGTSRRTTTAAGDLRVFRVDRIQRLAVGDDAAVPAADGFDAVTHVSRSLARVPWKWEVEVLLDVPIDRAAERIPATLGELFETERGTMLRMRVGSLSWMATSSPAGLRVHDQPAGRAADEGSRNGSRPAGSAPCHDDDRDRSSDDHAARSEYVPIRERCRPRAPIGRSSREGDQDAAQRWCRARRTAPGEEERDELKMRKGGDDNFEASPARRMGRATRPGRRPAAQPAPSRSQAPWRKPPAREGGGAQTTARSGAGGARAPRPPSGGPRARGREARGAPTSAAVRAAQRPGEIVAGRRRQRQNPPTQPHRDPAGGGRRGWGATIS